MGGIVVICYESQQSKGPYPTTKGGELITFVWLLMAQFGLKEHAWVEIRTRAKLNLNK